MNIQGWFPEISQLTMLIFNWEDMLWKNIFNLEDILSSDMP